MAVILLLFITPHVFVLLCKTKIENRTVLARPAIFADWLMDGETARIRRTWAILHSKYFSHVRRYFKVLLKYNMPLN